MKHNIEIDILEHNKNNFYLNRNDIQEKHKSHVKIPVVITRMNVLKRNWRIYIRKVMVRMILVVKLIEVYHIGNMVVITEIYSC